MRKADIYYSPIVHFSKRALRPHGTDRRGTVHAALLNFIVVGLKYRSDANPLQTHIEKFNKNLFHLFLFYTNCTSGRIFAAVVGHLVLHLSALSGCFCPKQVRTFSSSVPCQPLSCHPKTDTSACSVTAEECIHVMSLKKSAKEISVVCKGQWDSSSFFRFLS